LAAFSGNFPTFFKKVPKSPPGPFGLQLKLTEFKTKKQFSLILECKIYFHDKWMPHHIHHIFFGLSVPTQILFEDIVFI
jgi:hypothetical protein